MVGSTISPHPHPDFHWGCPDCGSEDITKPGRNTTSAAQPSHKCHNCGIRFWEPDEVRTEFAPE